MRSSIAASRCPCRKIFALSLSLGPGGSGGGGGTVFELAAPLTAGMPDILLHSFPYLRGADGSVPYSGVIMDSRGNLYGTTIYGGHGIGTVFELAAPLSAGMGDVVLHSFSGTPDGGNPVWRTDHGRVGEPVRDNGRRRQP